MTEISKSLDDGSTPQIDAVASLDINSLRTFAKIMGIKASREWGKEDFVQAIHEAQKRTSVEVVFNDANAPRPGNSRLLIHRDTSPGHKNGPVHVGVNGRLFAIPRGVEVDVPTEFVSALNDATYLVMSEVENADGTSRYVETMRNSYPFQVLASTPGAANRPPDPRARVAQQRAACKDEIGKWPTEGEFRDWLKANAMRRATTATG